MTVAGWCTSCGQYVYVGPDWACPNGHPHTAVVNHYEPETGRPVAVPWQAPQAGEPTAGQPSPQAATPPVAEPVPAAPPETPPVTDPAPAAPAPPAATPSAAATGTREGVLTAIVAAFAQYPGYAVAYGTNTDITISNQVADANWGTGKKKVEFEAALKAVEPERTVYYWEMLKEKGAGLSFGGMQAESYSTFGTKRSGKTKEVVIGPGGKAMDYTWDYGDTRKIVEATAAQHGWKVKTVLNKRKAQW